MTDLPITGGGNDLVLEPGQDLVLRDQSGTERLRLDAATGSIRIRSGGADVRIRIDPTSGNLLVGGSGQDGDLLLFPASAESFESHQSTIHLNAQGRSIGVGTSERPGLVRVRGNQQQIDLAGERGDIVASGHVDLRMPDGDLRVRLDNDGSIIAGGAGRDGVLRLRNGSNATVIRFDLAGSDARGRLGGDGSDGRLEVLDGDGTTTIVLNGATGNAGFGAVTGGNAGAVFVKGDGGGNTIVLNGDSGDIAIGAVDGGVAGGVFVKGEDGDDTIVMNGATGNIGLGRFGTAGNVFVKNEVGNNSIHLSGATGNINLTGDIRFSSSVADFAEEFDLDEPGECEPGEVMVLHADGRLRRSFEEYDSRVVGVISGAGAYRPGIVLGRDESKQRRVPVAVMGKVLCKVDASSTPIAIGDLLTTGARPGHAMKVTDRAKGVGAVIGKALGSCKTGQGLVPMLVSLQ
ncbi:MAG: hypothetical protein GEU90_09590 [Gemmatimonas sp.]|nr:hypothetical protein [Gemmatimonas sp.]